MPLTPSVTVRLAWASLFPHQNEKERLDHYG
jgi:hypothetical protein